MDAGDEAVALERLRTPRALEHLEAQVLALARQRTVLALKTVAALRSGPLNVPGILRRPVLGRLRLAPQHLDGHRHLLEVALHVGEAEAKEVLVEPVPARPPGERPNR